MIGEAILKQAKQTILCGINHLNKQILYSWNQISESMFLVIFTMVFVTEIKWSNYFFFIPLWAYGVGVSMYVFHSDDRSSNPCRSGEISYP